jgi:alpha-beta hydrolase superfamily lysophospholipase
MRPIPRPKLSLCLLLLAFVPALAGAAENSSLGRFDAAWEAYETEINGKGLQFGCQPRRYRPPADVARRGVVVAFHGFSACPQQFFQLGPLLSIMGFDVLVPMLPGHGLARSPEGVEQLDEVPTNANWRAAYGGLAARMNDIAALSPGEHVMVGYSLGGALALNAGFRAPDLYDRMLLIAPLVRIRMPAYLEGLTIYLSRVPGLRSIELKPPDMEQDCDDWTASGRAGFCDYRLEHIPAMIELERQNRTWNAERPLTLPMQAILADADVVVSTEATKKLAEAQRAHGEVTVCMLTGGVPHEILTPYENADREMFWLPQFIEVASAFVARGETNTCETPDAQ